MMDSTEEQGQVQRERQEQVLPDQAVHQRENELEVIGLDHLDKIIPHFERTSENGSEVDKRASEELFNGALAEVPNTNDADVEISDLRPDENPVEPSLHEDLDYGEDDDMNINHDCPSEAKNGISASVNEQNQHDAEQKQEKVDQKSADDNKDYQQDNEQQAPATDNEVEKRSEVEENTTGKKDEEEEKDEEMEKHSDKQGEEDAEDSNESNHMGEGRRRRRGIDDDCDGVEYIIERIISKRIDDDGIAKFLVKWENYPTSANTWEPLENLVGCEKALQKFELGKAKKLSKICRDGQGKDSMMGKSKNKVDQRYYVQEIIGMTIVEDDKYFVVSLEDPNESPKFIRSSLAKKMFPDRVIDFYVKNIRWDRD